MGRMFFSLGLLLCDDVVEISASDLVTGYVGQAGGKTLDMLTKARGKVLFIDEACQLNPQEGGSYMQEVADELLKCLTSEDFKGKMIVILAGYEKDMNAMLSVNQGLRSRFSAKLFFEDFSVEFVTELLNIRLAEYELKVSTSVVEELPSMCQQITEMSFFANGHDIDTIAKSEFRNCAVRVGCEGEPGIKISDIRLAIEALLSTKVMLDASKAGLTTALPLHASQQQNAFKHAIPQTFSAIDIATDTTVATGIKHVEENKVRGEEKEKEEKKEEEVENRTREYPALKVTEFTIKLQDLLNQLGLKNQEGVRILSELWLSTRF